MCLLTETNKWSVQAYLRVIKVRLPRPVALPESVKQVDIIPLSRARLITPAGEAWERGFGKTLRSDEYLQYYYDGTGVWR